MVQEEVICYWFSLLLSLKREFYFISLDKYIVVVLYLFYVFVICEVDERGYGLILFWDVVVDLKVVFVFSVVVVYFFLMMQIKYDKYVFGELEFFSYFVRDFDRDMMKKKMRFVLRLVVVYRYRRIILGVLGCGVFKNLFEDVVYCWLEVLREKEFGGVGNWWRGVMFVVYEFRVVYEGNLDIFMRVLDGEEV